MSELNDESKQFIIKMVKDNAGLTHYTHSGLEKVGVANVLGCMEVIKWNIINQHSVEKKED
jgi:hypothetical protein